MGIPGLFGVPRGTSKRTSDVCHIVRGAFQRPESAFACSWVDVGGIFNRIWYPFGALWEVSGVIQNVCFTIVKRVF